MLVEDRGRVRSLPAAWTSLASPDPFVAVSAGRSFFRIDDLHALVELLGRLAPRPGEGKGDSAVDVKGNMPGTRPSAQPHTRRRRMLRR